jgi:hypothetical protein
MNGVRLPVRRPVAVRVVAAGTVFRDPPIAVPVDSFLAELDVVPLAGGRRLQDARISLAVPEVPDRIDGWTLTERRPLITGD